MINSASPFSLRSSLHFFDVLKRSFYIFKRCCIFRFAYFSVFVVSSVFKNMKCCITSVLFEIPQRSFRNLFSGCFRCILCFCKITLSISCNWSAFAFKDFAASNSLSASTFAWSAAVFSEFAFSREVCVWSRSRFRCGKFRFFIGFYFFTCIHFFVSGIERCFFLFQQRSCVI